MAKEVSGGCVLSSLNVASSLADGRASPYFTHGKNSAQGWGCGAGGAPCVDMAPESWDCPRHVAPDIPRAKGARE